MTTVFDFQPIIDALEKAAGSGATADKATAARINLLVERLVANGALEQSNPEADDIIVQEATPGR